MTVSYRPWLPETVSCPDRIKPLLDQAIQDWALRWFPEAVVFSVTDLTEGLAKRLGGQKQYYAVFGDCIAIAKSAANDARLCQELLGYDAKQVNIASVDQLALDELAKACIDDLKQGLCQIFEVDHRSGGANNEPTTKPFQKRVWSCQLTDVSGKIKFSLAFEKDIVTQLVKSRIPATSSLEALVRRSESVGHAKVNVGAQVGTSKLTVAEMTQLEVGDVLMLDRKLTDPVTLTVNGEVMQQQLVIDRSKDQIALRLKTGSI